MILIIDGHNLMYRARSGFTLGEFPVVFNFFRQLRALVGQFKPTRAYMTLEGAPRRQESLLAEYKANRVIDPTDTVARAKEEAYRDQQRIIVRLLSYHFPVTVVQHKDFEADDTIYNLICRSSSAVDFMVVSTDTDFIQLLQQFHNVKLYNPVTKKRVEAPNYDYVTWKALRGDPTDNVPALVTEASALTLVNDAGALRELLKDNDLASRYARNYDLIHLREWTDEEAAKMVSSSPARDWKPVQEAFESMLFKSLLKDGTWEKFIATFDALWPSAENRSEPV